MAPALYVYTYKKNDVFQWDILKKENLKQKNA